MTIIQNTTREIKCKWCGKYFRVPRTREYNAVKYCSMKCSYYAWLEKNLETTRRYNRKYQDIIKQRLGDSRLGANPVKDFETELKLIRRELERIRRGE